ncbi:MAG: hypothetical protein JGK17_23430 [Microcoleus sp. PH2017_10_PVI_O_A]|uniref:hypothetical protein n=1 Tax=Microcoleus sp. PH2017_10_PVI_O_A TaxID=2798821 RepID=UPI001D272CE2|nr:hypothetical protein [Microcoleus sp. PH2017_10_PVI_O_A]MCC3408482.1 hypothetical protein [Microcoleus sp. PH2017_10_PVI_O_A]
MVTKNCLSSKKAIVIQQLSQIIPHPVELSSTWFVVRNASPLLTTNLRTEVLTTNLRTEVLTTNLRTEVLTTNLQYNYRSLAARI